MKCLAVFHVMKTGSWFVYTTPRLIKTVYIHLPDDFQTYVAAWQEALKIAGQLELKMPSNQFIDKIEMYTLTSSEKYPINNTKT